jgi:uncharacterized membrane protein
MLHDLIGGTRSGDFVLELIGTAALAIELLGGFIIVAAIVASTVRYLSRLVRRQARLGRYREYKNSLARSLLLGLEILVAADVVRTIALEATLQSVLVLGTLVLIRTFLSWSLVVEIEGHWPWNQGPEIRDALD